MLPVWTWLASAVLAFLAVVLLAVLRSRKTDLPPGPRGLPLVGYLPWIDPVSPHLTFTELAGKYGPVYGIQLGSVFAVVLSDAALIRETLSRSEFSGRAPLYLTHGIMNGNGIICAQGDKWKDQRKFVTSNLRNLGMVKSGERRCRIESSLCRALDVAVDKLNESSDNGVDTEHILMHAVGNFVSDLVFGKTWDERDETWLRLLRLQEEGTKLIGVAGPINFLPVLRFLPKYRKTLSYIKDGIRYSHGIYQQILKEYQSMESDGTEVSSFLAAFDREMSVRGDSPGYYTREQFNYLMADLWGAGVDTTITTLRWFFLYMATHKNHQERVQNEMDQILGDSDLRLSDIPNLPLLMAAISETQRIRSVTPLGFPHGAIQSGFISGYRIPKGSMIIPLQWAVHMDPSCHVDPDVFDPCRFLENGKYRKIESFLPFQTGKRVCLGEELARMILFLFGGSILQRFRLDAEITDLRGDVGITLTPKPHRITFTARRRGCEG